MKVSLGKPAFEVARAFAKGFAVDDASWQAGYAAGLAGAGAVVPAGHDLFSFYLGREEGRTAGLRKTVVDLAVTVDLARAS